MTPKEKAEDLFDKMYNSGDLSTFAARKCALRAVEEILNLCWNGNEEGIKYWKKVKNEINNIII